MDRRCVTANSTGFGLTLDEPLEVLGDEPEEEKYHVGEGKEGKAKEAGKEGGATRGGCTPGKGFPVAKGVGFDPGSGEFAGPPPGGGGRTATN